MKTYLLELEAVLEPGSRFGHEAGGVDAAVPQAAAIGEMSLEFFPVSSEEESRCRHKDDRLQYYDETKDCYPLWELITD